MEERAEEEKIRFIKEHAREILPTSPDPQTVKMISEGSRPGDRIDPKKIEKIVEAAETKIFTIKNKDASKEAKAFLIAADNPGAYLAVEPLLSRLKEDSRCQNITLLLSGKAEQMFIEKFPEADRVKDETKPLLYDLLKSVEEKKVDIVIATQGAKNNPSTTTILSGKEFGAQKIFLVIDGWGIADPNLPSWAKSVSLDGIFCNDALAKMVLSEIMRDFPSEKIFTTGTGQTDRLNPQTSEELRKLGREKMRLTENELAILYLGDISDDYRKISEKIDSRINEKTREDVISSLVALALKNPDKKYALLMRPHPRDPDFSEPDDLENLIRKLKVPPNLRVIPASNRQIGMAEAAQAADILASMNSTENFKFLFAGRPTIFLGLENFRGNVILEKMYGKNVVSFLEKQKNSIFAHTTADIQNFVAKIKTGEKIKPMTSLTQVNSAENILKVIFENK